MALTTAPYYRSTYVFLYRTDRGLDIRSFDDPKLRDLKIGIQLVGDEGSTTPAGLALARRGLANNVVGYTVYGDYRQDSPPARVVEAVANGEVDLAVVWGPLAGYFATKQPVPLAVVPVSPAVEPPGLPFAFDISVGVKKGDKQLRDELNDILARRRSDISRILDEYGVPRADEPAESAARARVP
jgi:mxaJ protein